MNNDIIFSCYNSCEIYKIEKGDTDKICLIGLEANTNKKCSIIINDVPHVNYIKFNNNLNQMKIKSIIGSVLQTLNINPADTNITKKSMSQWFSNNKKYNGDKQQLWQIIYSSAYNKLFGELMPYIRNNTIEYITGTNYTLIERFIIIKNFKLHSSLLKIKIDTSSPESNMSYFTKYTKEYKCNNINDIIHLENIEYDVFKKNIVYSCIRICPVIIKNNNENIISISSISIQTNNTNIILNEDINTCGFLVDKYEDTYNVFIYNDKLESIFDPNITTKCILNGEYNVLDMFSHIFDNIDPDLIIGYDLNKDLSILINRYYKHKLRDNLIKLGKLTQHCFNNKCKISSYKSSELTFNCCAILDIKSFFQSSKISTSGKLSFSNYSLCEIIGRTIGKESKENNPFEYKYIDNFYDDLNGNIYYFCIPNNINRLKERLYIECIACINISNKCNCVELFLELSNISWCPINIAFQGFNSKVNEWYMKKIFIENEWLIPEGNIDNDIGNIGNKRKYNNNNDNNSTSQQQIIKKENYKGGKVLKPVYGLHAKEMFLVDFQSMYPSIIAKYNICYTPNDKYKIIPKHMNDLMFERNKAKVCIKYPGDKNDIKQHCYKLMANSNYGCFAFPGFRFFNILIAREITRISRLILEESAKIVEKIPQCKIIFGDTDSLGIRYNGDQTKRDSIIDDIVKKIHFKFLIKLKLEHIIPKCFIYTKKSWSYMLSNGERIDKGMATIMRSFPKLTKDNIGLFLEYILSLSFKDNSKIIKYTNKIANKIVSIINQEKYDKIKKRPIQDFIIYKTLGKNISDYTSNNINQNIKLLPQHVRVAINMINKGDCYFIKGDSIPFVLCEGDVVCHPKELEYENSSSLIDIEKYLSRMVIRPLLLHCEKIHHSLPGLIKDMMGKTNSNNNSKLIKI